MFTPSSRSSKRASQHRDRIFWCDFNTKRSDTLATCAADGKVKVWCLDKERKSKDSDSPEFYCVRSLNSHGNEETIHRASR